MMPLDFILKFIYELEFFRGLMMMLIKLGHLILT